MLMQAKNITKTFSVRKGPGGQRHSFVRAVDKVDLDIATGESLGLVGESGSGKTTLGRVLLRLHAPDAGRVIFDGQDITDLSSRELRPLRRGFQMIFQDPYSSLDPRYSVRDILRESFMVQSSFPRQGYAKIKTVLRSVHLDPDCLNRFPHEFSGGERQRIAIARALMMEPRLLILDEPVSSLDVLIQSQIIELLRDLRGRYGMTYLFITHNLKVVRRVCSRVAVMSRGRVVEIAPTEKIFNEPMHPYTKRLLAAALDYRDERSGPIRVSRESALTQVGEGHYVLP